MTIEKLTKGGEVIAPATTTTAVIDPGTKMTLQELLMEALPLETGEIIDNEVIEVGKQTQVNYTFITRWKNVEVTSLCSYEVDGEETNGNTYTQTYNPTKEGEIEITVKTTYLGFEATDKFKVVATYPTYYGCISGETPTEADIKSMTSKLYGFKNIVADNISLANEKFVYAYPAYMGDLMFIKDGNGFLLYAEGNDNCTFKKMVLNIGSVPYNVYYMGDKCTVNNFKFLFR